MSEITDGTSNTLMIGEYATLTTPGRRTFWAYAYTSYNQSLVSFAQPWTLLPSFDACAGLSHQRFVRAFDKMNMAHVCDRGPIA